MIDLIDIIREYGIIEFEIHFHTDGFDIPISNKPTYRYTLTMPWFNDIHYVIWTDITPEAIDEVNFDIEDLEVSNMIDRMITKLVSIFNED